LLALASASQGSLSFLSLLLGFLSAGELGDHGVPANAIRKRNKKLEFKGSAEVSSSSLCDETKLTATAQLIH
jgi:hypothetical protein